jgi:hypothetical protein
VVEAAGEGGRGRRPAQGEVPLKEVVLEGLGVVVGGGVRGELGGLFDWSLVSGVAEGTRDGRIRRMVGFLELNCPTVVISAAKGVWVGLGKGCCHSEAIGMGEVGARLSWTFGLPIRSLSDTTLLPGGG